MDDIIEDLTEMYGLEGSWLDQYWAFWGRLFHGDFGVSFFQFPTRVNQLIATAMPWTLGLLLTTTAISWTLGNIIGGLAGYYSRKGWSRTLDAVAMVIRPLPYYIFAFTLLLLFASTLSCAGSRLQAGRHWERYPPSPGPISKMSSGIRPCLPSR